MKKLGSIFGLSSASYVESESKGKSSGERRKKKKKDAEASHGWKPEPLQSGPSSHQSAWSPGVAAHRPNEQAARGWPRQQMVFHHQQASQSQTQPHVQHQAQPYSQHQAHLDHLHWSYLQQQNQPYLQHQAHPNFQHQAQRYTQPQPQPYFQPQAQPDFVSQAEYGLAQIALLERLGDAMILGGRGGLDRYGSRLSCTKCLHYRADNGRSLFNL
jgi:hypothetical protein